MRSRADILVDRLVREMSERYHADLEQIVTEAVTNPTYCGVLVEWTGPTSWVMSIDPSVPYGNIYERRAPWRALEQ